MSDEIDALIARARRLEEENALLRSMQSPGGDDVALKAENVMLRNELSHVRGTASAAGSQTGDARLPETLQQFSALSPQERRAAVRRMTRKQRDELLGRCASRPNRESYL